MPSYSVVYLKLYRHITRQKCIVAYEEFSSVSEFLGASYDMRYSFRKKGFLFIMPRPLFIQFSPVDMRLLQHTGYLITYDMEYTAAPAHPVTYQIMSLFVSTGQSRNVSVQLIEYFEKKLVVFVKEDDYNFFMDVMTRILFDISEQFSFEIIFHTKHLHIVRD